ncbi:MAG: M20/M25/M40 family metallo-hydrolase [Acidobacteriota bacterium]|nr:M20/M25/M40 family metallo-hydrolase [Acidobacteriota bacterium]
MAANPTTGSAFLNDVSQERGIREALQWFTREKQWINDLHLQLCRIPSPTFLEQRRAEWVAAKFGDFGWETRIDRSGNVLATFGPPRGESYVAATAHLDTVLAPRNNDEISLDPDGKLHGPGVSDNGAGLTALLAVAKAVQVSPKQEEWQNDLLLVANVGEEGEGNLSGMRFLCKSSGIGKKIGSFLVLDGAATDHITTQALGSRRFEITFTGPGGHSWSDFGTGNPVHALSRAVSFWTEHHLNGAPRSSMNVGIVDGGTSVNSIPSFARAKVDIRSESDEKMDELVELLHAAVERAQDLENQRASGGKVAARIRDIGARPAAHLAEGAAILNYVKAVDAHLGIRSRVDCASTDANIPLSLGIPAVSIGAGGTGGGAHTAHEWFCPNGRDLGLKRVFLAVSLLLRNL